MDKHTLARILGLSTNSASNWIISDVNEAQHMSLLHYTDERPPTQPIMRGWVVDSKQQRLIARSTGYVPTIVATRLPLGEQELSLTDLDGTTHQLSLADHRIKIGQEGTILRVFKHQGQVYFSSHRRLTTDRSTWGRSNTFRELYSELGGPEGDKLFDSEKADGCYCYIFLLVHPQLMAVTRMEIGDGHLVYLGANKMCEPNSDLPDPTVDWVLRMPPSNDIVDIPNLQLQVPIDIDTANRCLAPRGAPSDERDPRLEGGNFVIVYQVVNTASNHEETGACYRVVSPAYHWRSTVRNNNPNLAHRLYELLDFTGLDDDSYRELFPIFAAGPLNAVPWKELLTICQQANVRQEFIRLGLEDNTGACLLPTADHRVNDESNRVAQVVFCLLMATPYHQRGQVVAAYLDMAPARERLVHWLANCPRWAAIENLDYVSRARDLVAEANRAVDKRPFKGGVSGFKARQRYFRTTLARLLREQSGVSLYQLLRLHCRALRTPSSPREESD